MQVLVYYSHTSLMKFAKQELSRDGFDIRRIEEEVLVGNRRVDVMYMDEEHPVAIECKTFKHTEEGLAEYAQKNPGHRRILVMPLFSADEIWFIGDRRKGQVIKIVVNGPRDGLKDSKKEERSIISGRAGGARG
ncbi:MAG: hypothetical protein ACP5GO_00185 [Thermoprotei archaeon]